MTPRVATLGETMALLRTREIGSLRHVSDAIIGIGGAESNVAIGLRRLGIASKWLGRVGDDPLGERVTREIRAEGVDVHGVIDSEAATGLMLKERPTVGSTAVFYYRNGSAGSRLRAGDVPPGWVEDVDLVHVSGITAMVSDVARDCVLAVIDRAKTAGVRVSFDVNYRAALATPDIAGPLLRKVAERADIVFGGPDELQLLYPDSDPVGAAQLLVRGGCSDVVLKKGADGAAAYLADGVVEGPGFCVEVVDTVGAGDAFVAGYLSGLLHGLDVAGRLHRANACGALLCMTPGDWESSPTLEDVERFGEPDVDPVLR
ncbi:sugar kinase [Mycolicibacterium sp. CH28]|uniref:sugar kinase n=1 Tax=Mycolicibacterium sp. CH28 TaxID=2512237 RepID=UPI0010804BD4|nr:sugar kinase [Mycolicibacterium sp. CH28]TGD88895.1 sugar kinase [Mycolicibacterium sp. CH28]